jgi:diamine N-acetyltransferase
VAIKEEENPTPDHGNGVEPIISIAGTLVNLGPVDRLMLPTLQRWINALDVQVLLGMSLPGPFSADEQERWYDAVIGSTSSRTFAILESRCGRVVGTTSIQGINWHSRSGVFGIMIGDPEARGRGLGTETTRLMLDYAFTVLGLHSVNLTVAEFNVAGRKAYAKAGFLEVGRLREHWFAAGRWWDQISMDCLATEFSNSVLAPRLHPESA